VIADDRGGKIDGGMAMDDKPHGSALRRGRYSEPGRIYLVTTVTQGRKPVFHSLTAARILIRSLMYEQEVERAWTLAYVVMPDHLHWLMRLGEGLSLAAVVRGVKSVTAHRIGGVVWQAGFHDHALRQDEDLVKAARYILANPLRAGLVKQIGDYPHWDAVWM
jgi:REP element-mobilizing transposase RayT